MRYIKEILKNNKLWVLAYIGLGIFNVLAVLRNSEKSDSIMFYKNDMYKIS